MQCQNLKCKISHDGKYGSGKFCSRSCSNTRDRPLSVRDKISTSLSGREYPDRPPLSLAARERFRQKQKHVALLKSLDHDFESLGFSRQRKIIIHEQNGQCNKCGINKWFEKDITLEIEHKDGNHQNNKRNNMEALCPNCHSITDTWRGRNKNSMKNNVSDEEMIIALTGSKTIRQALLSLGLAAKGGNYNRAKKLLLKI
jgi:hypothetical protein